MSEAARDEARCPLVAVVDYRMGNLRSMKTSLGRAGAGVRIVTGPEGLEGAHGLVLPGVGAFGPAMANLAGQELLDPVLRWARAGRPFLAVCVGMQLLFDESEEDGHHRGLGLIPGRVRRLPEGGKVPQMGWNTTELTPARASSVYGEALSEGAYYYYAHSYCAHATDADTVLATTTYGVRYASVVGKGRTLGTQFHPEKSAEAGLTILRRFVEMCREAK